MTPDAIIPRPRASASVPMVKVGPGLFAFSTATAADYRALPQSGDWDFGAAELRAGTPIFPSKGMSAHIKAHGIPVLYEIFDTIHPDVHFKISHLIGELCTIAHLKPKGQREVIYAVLRWQEGENFVRQSSQVWTHPSATKEQPQCQPPTSTTTSITYSGRKW